MIVVKVGGSLFDHPALGPGLRAYLDSLAPAEVLLVPGGGPVADAVRELDRVHALGEESSHWLALKALDATAQFLGQIVARPVLLTSPLEGEVAASLWTRRVGGGGARSPGGANPPPGGEAPPTSPSRGEVKDKAGSRLAILDCFAFALEDDSRPGALPHAWAVTSDSLAARVAAVYRAERLVLLKSVDVPPGTPWAEAAARGWVDPHFPHVAATLPCPVEALNFRVQLDSRA